MADSTDQQNPSIAGEDQETINGTIRSASLTPTETTREWCAVSLQMSEALSVFGVENAGTTGGVAVVILTMTSGMD